MTGPRYSIIPRRFFEDSRPMLSHTKVIGVLGTHSNETGWCRLKQRTISNSSTLSRETVNRAISDLVEWGYVEKKDIKGYSSAYRVLMDSSAAVPKDLPDIDITCELEITPPCDGTDHRGCDAPSHRGCDVVSHNKNDPSLTIKDKRSASEANNSDLKVKRPLGAQPEITLTSDDGLKWLDWIKHLTATDSAAAARAEASGVIIVTSNWPREGSRVILIPRVGLSEKSKQMAGGR